MRGCWAGRPSPTRRSGAGSARFGPEAGLAFWLFVTRDWVELRCAVASACDAGAYCPVGRPGPSRFEERANDDGALMAFPRRARRLFGYWRAERRTLRQGLVALVLSTAASFVAGLTLGHITGTLDALPGLLS